VPPEAEHHVGDVVGLEPELPLSVDGVVRYVWHSRFGDMLIEAIDGQVFVNGDVVNAIPTKIPAC
jgi:hypothetical protein